MMTLRICPKRDAVCPHGMDCQFVIDRFNCKDEQDSPVTRDKALEIIRSVAYTTALKHREEGRRVLADQIDAALAVTVPSPVTPAPVGDVLPCPFCGKEPRLRDYDWPHKPAYMNCDDCGVVLDAGDGTPAEVIAAWNRRTPPSDTSGEAVAWRYRRDASDGWSVHYGIWPKRWSEDGWAPEPLYPASALAAAEARGVQIGLERAAKSVRGVADDYAGKDWQSEAMAVLEAYAAILALSPAHKGSENV